MCQALSRGILDLYFCGSFPGLVLECAAARLVENPAIAILKQGLDTYIRAVAICLLPGRTVIMEQFLGELPQGCVN